MTEELTTILINILLVVITGTVPILLAQLRVWFKNKQLEVESRLSKEELALMEQFLEIGIEAAEQTLKDVTGPDKKRWVLNQAKKYRDDQAVALTDEQLDLILEGIISAVKV